MTEPRPRNLPLDPLSELLQTAGYSAGHPFEDVLELVKGIRRRMCVSRFYWQPKIAVDFERDATLPEREAKKTALAARGVRYIVVRDAFDTQAARQQLQPRRVQNGGPPVSGKPRTAARAPRGKARAAR